MRPTVNLRTHHAVRLATRLVQSHYEPYANPVQFRRETCSREPLSPATSGYQHDIYRRHLCQRRKLPTAGHARNESWTT
jgi:hypothetical protein